MLLQGGAERRVRQERGGAEQCQRVPGLLQDTPTGAHHGDLVAGRQTPPGQRSVQVLQEVVFNIISLISLIQTVWLLSVFIFCKRIDQKLSNFDQALVRKKPLFTTRIHYFCRPRSYYKVPTGSLLKHLFRYFLRF